MLPNTNKPLHTPILFLVFNRPDTTQIVFDAIRKARPTKLYIAGDGARQDKISEDEAVAQVRTIATAVDWPCEVFTLFQEKNLGCKLGVRAGIDWFFSLEEAGIILEDDCLPVQSFFSFCEATLEKYKDNHQVFMISGNNFQFGRKRGNASYYFSKYPNAWGWASWRRAWKHYDAAIDFYPDWKKSKDWIKTFPNFLERKKRKEIYDLVFLDQLDTWDYSWEATILYKKGLVVVPNQNLVTNIGFGINATHTTMVSSALANLPTFEMAEISHPKKIIRNKRAEFFYSMFLTLNNYIPTPRFLKTYLFRAR